MKEDDVQLDDVLDELTRADVQDWGEQAKALYSHAMVLCLTHIAFSLRGIDSSLHDIARFGVRVRESPE